MGQLMTPIRDPKPAVRVERMPPAHPERMVGIALRLPDGRSVTGLLAGGGLLLGLMALIVSLLGVHSEPPVVVEALERVIEAKDETISALAQSNANLAAANDNLTKVATTTVTGLDPSEFIAFGAVVMIGVGLSLLATCSAMGGVFFSIVGVILLLTGGG